MPGIVVFKRRWKVSSDDFVFSSFAEILLRTTWLIILIVTASVYSNDMCFRKSYTMVFYIGMIIILTLTIFLTFLLMVSSMRGRIADTNSRRHVVKILMAKIALFMIEVGWVIYGTYVACIIDRSQCPNAVFSIVVGILITGWILIGILLVGVFIVYDPLGKSSSYETDINSREKNLWKRRLKFLCCCCCVNIRSERAVNAFDDIATLIADYFHGLDFVASDVSAGFLLVQEEQKRTKDTHVSLDSVPYPESSVSLFGASPDGMDTDSVYDRPEKWMNIPLAFHFMQFAMGSYGWPFFIYSNPCTGACKLMPDCRCCSCIRSVRNSTEIVGDNCCDISIATIIQETGIAAEDIIYANFTNKIYETPFYVAMDHCQKAVVIAVRGTLSFKDALTDLEAGGQDLHVDGITETKAHRGILEAARYIETTLQNKRILDKAFTKEPSYQLVLTGHSLGAGAAAILAILLRQVYPRLVCFAFSPPGGLLSLSLSRFTEDFICSVVVGDDIVPRLGLHTMEKLKQQLINAISSCNKPKYKILMTGMWRALFCAWKDDVASNIELSNNPEAPNSTIETQSNQNADSYNDNSSSSNSRVQQPLYMPGRVLFLHETQSKKFCGSAPKYHVYWRKAQSFDEILLSGPKLLMDHFPDVVSKALFSASQNPVA